LSTQTEFEGAREILEVEIEFGNGEGTRAGATKAELFIWTAEIILEGNSSDEFMKIKIFERLSKAKLQQQFTLNSLSTEGGNNFRIFFQDLKRVLYQRGLIDLKKATIERNDAPFVFQYWELASDGQAQYKLFSGQIVS